MKKILSVLGTFAIVTPGITTVVSCGAKTNPIRIIVDGNNEFKVGDKVVGYDKMFGSNSILSILGYQVLDALTFSENKYSNKDKLARQKEVLGKNGLEMSLDNLNNKKENNQESIISFLDETKGSFIKDYNQAVDSNFTVMDFNLGLTNPSIKKDEIWKSDSISTFTSNTAKTIETNFKYEYNKGKILKTTITQNPGKSKLDEYINTKWSDKITEEAVWMNPSLSKFKESHYYTMTSDQATEMFNEIDKLSDADIKSKLLGNATTPSLFKSYHTKLSVVESRYKNGILMPGKPALPNGTTSLWSDTGKKPTSNDVSKNNTFYKNKENNAIQSQIVGGNDNENRTFVYSENTEPLNIDFTFTIPGDKKRGRKEANYSLKLTLNNLIVGYQLVGINLDITVNDDKKIDTATNIYWYEPAFYQFTKKEMFRTSSDNKGTKNVFEELMKAIINISKK